MKDIKLITAIISAIVLGACTSGGGINDGIGGGSVPSQGPTYHAPSVNESLTVNSGNENITGMSSSTVTNETEVRNAMIALVADKLGDDIYSADTLNSLPTRGATTRGGRPGLSAEEKFFIANAKLMAMRNTLMEMAAAEDLAAYIAENEAAVAEALLLFGQDIDLQNIDVDELLADFNTIISGTDIATAITQFEDDTLLYNRAMLDSVRFQDAGDAESYFKFHLNGDVIDQVAMFEGDTVNDYGWFTKTDDAGGNVFGKTLYGYLFELGNAPGGTQNDPVGAAGYTDAQLAAFRWFNSISGHDDINFLNFRNELDGSNLTNADKMAAMLTILNKEFAEFGGSQDQNQGEIGGLTVAQAIAIVQQYYIDLIYNAFGYDPENPDDWTGANGYTAVLNQAVTPLNLTVTMHGLGKDLGLKYSDLGYAHMVDVHLNSNGTLKTENTFAPYGGGYDERKVDPGDVSARYTGTAIAGVQWSTKDVNGNKDGDGMLLTNQNATLDFNGATGVSTLTMNNLVNDEGDKWYNVTVSGDFSGDTPSGLTFTFDGTGKTTDENYDFVTNPATVEFASNEWQADAGVFKQGTTDDAGHDVDYRGSASVDYYGPMDTPTEAGALFHFSEEQHYAPDPENPSQEYHHEVGFYGAFGGTHD